MKKSLCIILIICLFASIIPVSYADKLNLTTLSSRDTFYYNDETNWTYYQETEKIIPDGTNISILAVVWGNKSEITSFPELRFFIETPSESDIYISNATIIIDGNMFDLSLDELELDNYSGSCFYFIEDAIPFVKALATANSFSAILKTESNKIQYTLSSEEVNPISVFANDLLGINYLQYLSETEKDEENYYQSVTPIVSYIFNELPDIDKSAHTAEASDILTDDGWNEYPLNEIGVCFYLPSHYEVFTRNMDASDPLVLSYGMTPDDIDSFFVERNFYLDSFDYDNDSEIYVTMIGSILDDFSNMSDLGLQSSAELWKSSLEASGTQILDMDIYHHNNAKFVRMHEYTEDYDGSPAYAEQYYTTVNNQAINFVYVSFENDLTETEQDFMRLVVDRAVLGLEITISNPTTFAEEPENFLYNLQSDGTACITGYNGLTSTIAIPSSIDKHPVTAISNMENNFFISNLFIPDSVTSIDGNPFTNLSTLKSITVSEEHPVFATTDGILYNKNKQELICYPQNRPGDRFSTEDGTITIGSEAFFGNENLKQIGLNEGLKHIGDNAFYGVSGVPSITIPNTVSEIGLNPFYGMANLEEIMVNSGNLIFTVQQGALYNRTTNKMIAFPRKYVTSSFAFRQGVTEIGDHVFYYYSNPINISFPNSITVIGDSAFYECKNISFTNYPPALKSIGSMAFSSSSIESIVIPSTIQNVGRSSFNSASLSSVIIKPGLKTIPFGMFVGCNNLTTIVLPESVDTIEDRAFRSCKNLESIYIPNSVINFGKEIFDEDEKLTVYITKGSAGEKYCIDNNIPFDFFVVEDSIDNPLRIFEIPAGPFHLELDDTKYNILLPGMSDDELSVIRSGLTADNVDLYLDLTERDLMLTKIEETIPAEFSITVRVKDKKYEGVDLKTASSFEAFLILEQIYSSFDQNQTSNKEILTINDVPYLKFDWDSMGEQRYATIIDGDMIYIYAENKNNPLSEADKELLREVVEAIKYPTDENNKSEMIPTTITQESYTDETTSTEPFTFMTYEEYISADLDTPVCIETYVQAHQSWWDGKVTTYTQDKDGAYFIYNMACSEEDAAKLTPGTKIMVKGYKAEWSGEVEIVDATFEFLDGDSFVAEATDVTELLGTNDLVIHQNQLVSLKGMTVEAYDNTGAAFAYKNDTQKTDDLYFKVSKDGKTFEFCVEYYLCGEETEVYKAVEALKVGDIIDLEGFLYWYEGPNLHTTGIYDTSFHYYNKEIGLKCSIPDGWYVHDITLDHEELCIGNEWCAVRIFSYLRDDYSFVDTRMTIGDHKIKRKDISDKYVTKIDLLDITSIFFNTDQKDIDLYEYNNVIFGVTKPFHPNGHEEITSIKAATLINDYLVYTGIVCETEKWDEKEFYKFLSSWEITRFNNQVGPNNYLPYFIKHGNLSIYIPEGWDVFLKDSDELQIPYHRKDFKYKDKWYTASQFTEIMNVSSAYLQCISEDKKNHLTLNIYDHEDTLLPYIDNFSSLDNETIDALKSIMLNEINKSNVAEITSTTTLDGPNVRFLCFCGYSVNEKAYVRFYMTITKHQIIEIDYFSYDDEIDILESSMIDAIVSNIIFDS